MEANGPFIGLEPVQYNNVYFEDDAPLDDVRKNALRLLIYLFLLMIVILSILGSTIKLPQSVTYSFVLKGNERERVYRFFDNIYLDEKYVTVGQLVSEGDPLLRISSPQIASLINAYNNARTRQSLFAKLGTSLYTNQIQTSHLKKAKSVKGKEELQKQVAKLEAIFQNELKKEEFLVEEARRELEVQRRLFNSGVVSKLDLDKVQEKLVIAEFNLNGLKENHEKEIFRLKDQMEVSDIDTEITENEYKHTLKELENEEVSLEDQAKLAYEIIRHNYGDVSVENGSIILKASARGRVSYLLDTEKDVPSGSAIIKIKGDDNSVYASSAVSPDKIGLIKENARVVLRVSTFPHYDWGGLEGKVRFLSLTPDEQGNYPFEVEITNSGKMKELLQIGMAGELSITIVEKTFFGYLFERAQQGYYAMTD